MKVAIIGAGWAGAACAWQLKQWGYQVTLFESARIAGGRARRVNASWGPIDNGQHLLIGAYTSTLHLMSALGIEKKQNFYCKDISFQSLSGHFHFRFWPLPSPWHQLGVLFGSKGLRFSDKLALMRLISSLRKMQWQPPKSQTVQTLLKNTNQPTRLIHQLWQPLCIAALNTPLEQASAQIFAAVLRDSLGHGRHNAKMLIPKQDMSRLWVEKALESVHCYLGTPIKEIKIKQTEQGMTNGLNCHYKPLSKKQRQRIEIHGQCFDACVIATQIPSAIRLLEPLACNAAQKKLIKQLKNIQFNPIATLYLQPKVAWSLKQPILMLEEDRSQLHAGQWLFNHSALNNSFAQKTIAVVISDAGYLKNYGKEEITNGVIRQIQNQLPNTAPKLPPILQSLLITEQRATFLATPDLKRPKATSPWPNIYFAADWVQSDYPAVLEAAVRSGLKTAQIIKKSHCP